MAKRMVRPASFIKRVKELMAAGGSYSSVAKTLGVKKGVVAGICNRHNIASTNSTGFNRHKSPKQVSASAQPVTLIRALIRACQCEYTQDEFRCVYQVVDSNAPQEDRKRHFCIKHL